MNLLKKTGWLVSLLLMTSLVQAQTCPDNIKRVAPDTRYTIQAGGEEVLDKQTQLIWKRCAEGLSGSDCNTGEAGIYTWELALALADNTWRLPDIKELASLVETACYYPTINSTFFPNTRNGLFWSSSSVSVTSSHYAKLAWQIIFSYGFQVATYKSENAYVRLVRNGQ